jgi:hypothetical protein
VNGKRQPDWKKTGTSAGGGKLTPDEFAGMAAIERAGAEMSWGRCIEASAASGMTAIAVPANPFAVAGGFAVGKKISLNACPAIAPAISANERLTPAKFGALARRVRAACPDKSRRQVLDMIVRGLRGV